MVSMTFNHENLWLDLMDPLVLPGMGAAKQEGVEEDPKYT